MNIIKWFMKKERILLFIFSMFSLLGFFLGLENAHHIWEVQGIVGVPEVRRWTYGGFYLFEFFQIWMGFSIPLIIQNICFICFRDKK
jgi:hypothetical protein